MSEQATSQNATPLDERWVESAPRLVEAIRDEILASPTRWITFARFMERALTEPRLGYYATSDRRPTREGDFLTAAELHPFFGRVVGRQLDEMWQRLDRPSAFTVREYGAGRGTLAAAIADGLTKDGSRLAEALVHEAVDIGRHAPAGRVVGCILANEFFDALPVHRVVQRGRSLRELFVTWRDGWFADQEGEPSTPSLHAHLATEGVSLAEGQETEIGRAAEAWMARAAGQLLRGYLLVIDYGHTAEVLHGPDRMAGTLLGYRGHGVQSDPYRAVGRTDLTAHVDLTALELAAARAGLEPVGSTTQAEFVAALGIGDLLSELGRDASTRPEDYLLARSSVARLLDPRQLGAFRVVCWARDAPVEPTLGGFSPLRRMPRTG